MEGPSPRIVKETKTIQTDPVPGITFQPDPNNYKHFFIELSGTDPSIQDLRAPATRAASSVPNCFCPMTTLCLLPKWCSTPKSTTPTSVLLLPPRQLRKDLPRHPQEELVTSPTDEISAAIDPESAGRA